MVILNTYIPIELTHIIKCFWHLHIPAATKEPIYEHIVPDGHHELIFHLERGAGKRMEHDRRWTTEPSSFLAGQTTRPYALVLEPGAELYGIRFHPFSIGMLLRFPIHEATDCIIPLDALPEIKLLENCLDEGVEVTFMNFEALLKKWLQESHQNEKKFQYAMHAVNTIMAHNGIIKTKEIQSQLDISQKYLNTVFRDLVGITPKAFSNIIQVGYFIKYRNKYPEKNFTKVGYEAGFYDQSHLIKTFKTFTGHTPKEFFALSNSINSSFVVL